ncbi:MAG: MGMT family protein [Clostridia bacterium]|nr:MGMT family protein [Clostridia bacterium]
MIYGAVASSVSPVYRCQKFGVFADFAIVISKQMLYNENYRTFVRGIIMTFDESVYEYLTEIPKGKVVTYGQIAEHLGNPKLARAVGNALHRNPCGDKYPCYKVLNSRGELSRSYAFGGIEEQKKRLENDGVEVINYTVNLKIYRYDNR